MFFTVAQTGRNRFFFYLITISAVLLAQIIGQLPLVWVITANDHMMVNPAELTGHDLNGMEQNLLFLLLLIPFVFGMVTLWICIHKLHRRPFKSLITPFNRIRWRKIINSFTIWFILLAMVELAFFITSPNQYILKFRAGPFFVLLAISILILPVQTSFEEIFFRGYLMQGLGNLFKSPWIALLSTSIAFGLLHIWNPEVSQFGIAKMIVYYVSFGLFLGAITLVDSTLELALGIHAANNIYSAVMVGFSGSALQTPSLFYLTELDVNFMLIGYLIAIIIYILVFFWKSKFKTWKKLIVWKWME